MQKKQLVLSLCTILGILMTSCAPAAAPPPPAETPKPAATSAPKPPTTPAATPKAAGEQPRYGGTLNLAHSADPPELDPMWNPSYGTQGLVTSSYNGLVEYDPLENDKIVNRLAESWRASDDGKVFTFNLRKDARWHDGKVFQAADVQRTIEAWKNPPKGKQWFQVSLASMIARSEIVDGQTIRVALTDRHNSFLGWLATVFAVIAPSHIIDTQGGQLKNTVVGTGPFKFKRYDPGVVYQAEKNKDFFIKGWPYLDGLAMWIIKDDSTRFAGFRTGKVHVTSPYDAISAAHAEFVGKEMRDASVIRVRSLGAHAFAPQHTRGPWRDARVRRAASLAFDRQAAVQVLAQGFGTVGTPLPAGAWSMPLDELKQMPGYRQPKEADVAEAKRLMAEAGRADGFESKVLTRAGDTRAENLAIFSAEQLRKIGIRLKVDSQERGMWSRARANKDFDTLVLSVATQFSEPGGALIYFGPGNDFAYESQRRDEAVKAYEAAPDSASRAEAGRRLERVLLDEVPYVVLLWEERAVAFWKNVKNVQPWVGHQNNNKWAHVWLAG
ncbi:MAG: ABC transporter substrate-binding protein [Chloroflexi bacterium]|nr:ABC transporter substrate-binding protein [Chloroflexota bacterium]